MLYKIIKTSGYSNTVGSFNTFIGEGSGYSNSWAKICILDLDKLVSIQTEGSNNLFIGNNAGYSNQDSANNILDN